jgi:hypothetical protein
MKCKLCNREEKQMGFCTLHLRAYRNLCEKFTVWQQALDVSWSQYLVDVQKNSLTGVWAKDVSKHLIEEANKDDK